MSGYELFLYRILVVWTAVAVIPLVAFNYKCVIMVILLLIAMYALYDIVVTVKRVNSPFQRFCRCVIKDQEK